MNVRGGPKEIIYDYPKEYQYYPQEYVNKYPESVLRLFPQGLVEYGDTKAPSQFSMDIEVVTPVKVKYSLYTFKKTFSQIYHQTDNRNRWAGLEECALDKPLTTQADIDNSLDKIYEFPVVTETASAYKELQWNGYTDPKFTGQKYAVRDCLYIAAHNADTGELIDTQATIFAAEMYKSTSLPGIIYRVDTDSNGKETLSGKVIVAYPDSWPIKRITALITTSTCIYGALPFEAINQGADAIVADINKRLPGYVIARLTLTNPTVDKNNKNIKIFDWKDIKTEDGKDLIPDLEKYPEGYSLAIIMDMDEMTFTGIKNGSMWYGQFFVPLVSLSTTANETIEKSEIKIISDENGFVVLCPSGVLAKSYAIYDMVGRTLKTGSLSGLPRETITAPNLRSGVYFVHLQVNENGKDQTVTKKVVR